MTHRTIHLFRKGLRLHDNLTLLGALESSSALYPVYVLDREFTDEAKRLGSLRWRFVLQSLEDLDGRLRALGSRLYVLRGSTLAVLRELVTRWAVTQISYDTEVEPHYTRMDREIQTLAQERGIKTHTCVSHTLYDVRRCDVTSLYVLIVCNLICAGVLMYVLFLGLLKLTVALLLSRIRNSFMFCQFWANRRNPCEKSPLKTFCKTFLTVIFHTNSHLRCDLHMVLY